MRDQLLRWKVAKDILVDDLKEYPSTLETLEARRIQFEDFLVVENALSTQPAKARLRGTLLGYADILHSNINGLSGPVSQMVAYGQVAEWLMLCPLDFAEPADD
jgi:hypothetical protein